MSVDAVVVGAGPNGLAAAVVLARAGRGVVVLERGGTPGGGTRSAALTLPGFVHDVCAAIHPLAVASPFFREEAEALGALGLELVHPDAPLAHPLDDGSAVVLERSVEATAAGLGPDAAAYRRLIGPFVGSADRLFGEVLGPPLHVPRHPWLLVRFGARAVRSARGLAGSYFRGERARALFAGLAAHAILPLERRPTAAIGLVLAVAGHAVGWPLARGGSQAIADALTARVRALGGTVETGRAVETMDDLPPARAYLFDVAPRHLARIAAGRLPDRYRRRLERFRHGPGAFKVDWALAGPVPWSDPACARAATVHLGGTFEEIAAAEAEVWRGRHPDRPFVLLAQPGLFDPSRAPAGCHTGWAYCHVPAGSTEDMTDRIEAQVERFAPGFRRLVLARHTWGPADFDRYNPNYVGGDITGGVADMAQLIARPTLRPDPYRTPAPDIFLCSASTPPGAGVHGMCGAGAARSALRGILARR